MEPHTTSKVTMVREIFFDGGKSADIAALASKWPISPSMVEREAAAHYLWLKLRGRTNVAKKFGAEFKVKQSQISTVAAEWLRSEPRLDRKDEILLRSYI